MSEKPWYHGVKWRVDPRNIHDVQTTFGEEICSAFPASEKGASWVIAGNIPWTHKEASRHAQLIAAAPETATERDRLAAENERLREALALLADGGEITESSGSSGEITISGPDGEEVVFSFASLSFVGGK